MPSNKVNQLISLEEIRTMLALCQKLVALSHPSAAEMIKYAAHDLEFEDAIQKQTGNIKDKNATHTQNYKDEPGSNNSKNQRGSG